MHLTEKFGLSARQFMGPMPPRGEQNCVSVNLRVWGVARLDRRDKFCDGKPVGKYRPGNHCDATCDKASPAAAVVLHLRSCYVSKAAILTLPVRSYRSKIEVPLEFQGFGSLGAASWRRFFPCGFDSKKSALWLLKIRPFRECPA